MKVNHVMKYRDQIKTSKNLCKKKKLKNVANVEQLFCAVKDAIILYVPDANMNFVIFVEKNGSSMGIPGSIVSFRMKVLTNDLEIYYKLKDCLSKYIFC